MHVSVMKVLLVNTWDHIQAEVEAPQMEALKFGSFSHKRDNIKFKEG